MATVGTADSVAIVTQYVPDVVIPADDTVTFSWHVAANDDTEYVGLVPTTFDQLSSTLFRFRHSYVYAQLPPAQFAVHVPGSKWASELGPLIATVGAGTVTDGMLTRGSPTNT
jgi:hypothetical protein